jgi:hypothetical protein
MKIVEFFSIIWGTLSELEPEFLTRWSRSRTKMDRLRNTALISVPVAAGAKEDLMPYFHSPTLCQ